MSFQAVFGIDHLLLCYIQYIYQTMKARIGPKNQAWYYSLVPRWREDREIKPMAE